MKIAKDLPQFLEKTALLVSVGLQEAKAYIARDGILTEVAGIALPTPTYSDNEGFFGTRGRGVKLVSGSVREKSAVREKVHAEFLKELNKELALLVRKERVEEIYLFCPTHLLKPTRESLSKEIQKLIVKTLPAVRHDSPPFALLEKVKRVREKAV